MKHLSNFRKKSNEMPFVVANDCGIWAFFRHIFESTIEGYSPVEKENLKKKVRQDLLPEFWATTLNPKNF